MFTGFVAAILLVAGVRIGWEVGGVCGKWLQAKLATRLGNQE